MDTERLKARLRNREGWRSDVYMDTTGNLTIGYGFNLAHVSGAPIRLSPVTRMPPAVGELWLDFLVCGVLAELREALSWFDTLDEPRQQVLADMAYNMGVPGLVKEWPNFLRAVDAGEYLLAGRKMRTSRWRQQVHDVRAMPLIRMMETGVLE